MKKIRMTAREKVLTALWACLFSACVIVMVATPVAYSLRYVYIFAIGLPLFMALPLIEANRARKNGESLDRNA